MDFRYSPEDAARMIDDLAHDLHFIELSNNDAIATIKFAKKFGARGGRIHDLMHVSAARKANAEILITLDLAGFIGLAPDLTIKSPSRQIFIGIEVRRS